MARVVKLMKIRRGDDRYTHLFCEDRPKKVRSEHEPSGGGKVKDDSQPVYKVKPNTGRIPRGITKKR